MPDKRLPRRSQRLKFAYKPGPELNIKDMTEEQLQELLIHLSDSDSSNASGGANEPSNKQHEHPVDKGKRKADCNTKDKGKRKADDTGEIHGQYKLHDSDTDSMFESDEPDSQEDYTRHEVSKKKIHMSDNIPSKVNSVTGGANRYEARRLLQIRENQQKFQSLGLNKFAKTQTSMAEGSKSTKEKEKVVDTADEDEDYVPDSESDSIFEGDDEQPDSDSLVEVDDEQDNVQDETTFESSKKNLSNKPIRRRKRPALPMDLLEKKKFLGPRTLHWPTLEKLNLHTKFNEWLTPVWNKFFSITRPVYKELVYEFFTSYRFKDQTENLDSKSSMQFSLLGKKFQISISDFAVAMNLYTKAEVKGQDFISGLTSWPSDVNTQDFWSTVGVGEYKRNMLAASIDQPSYKLLHRAISESINQRGCSTNLVTRDDLFYMYCIVKAAPCNLAMCLARYLSKSTGKTFASAVCGGAYITQLAIGLGVCSENDLVDFDELASTTFFDEANLRKLGIIEKDSRSSFAEQRKDPVADAAEDTTTESTLTARIDSLENEVHWINNTLHRFIQLQGYSFVPPPHLLCADGRSSGNSTAGHSNVGFAADPTSCDDAHPSDFNAPDPSSSDDELPSNFNSPGPSTVKYTKLSARRLPVDNDHSSPYDSSSSTSTESAIF